LCVAKADVADASGSVTTMGALENLLEGLLQKEHVLHAWIDGDRLMAKIDTDKLGGK